tara:strand:- start:350 stop:532 length:183 start_codon:yes stop_codon:yes gene_type:complete
MTKKLKQQKYKPGSINDLKEQLENVENKLRAEMSWFRDEIAPLKNKQRQLLHEIEKLTDG